MQQETREIVLENSSCVEYSEIPVHHDMVVSMPNENDVESSLPSDGEGSNTSDTFMVTQDMLQIEKQLESEYHAENQSLYDAAMKEVESVKRKGKCFDSLKKLLNRSNLYAQFLVDQIDKKKVLAAENKTGTGNQLRQKLKELQQPSAAKQMTYRQSKRRKEMSNFQHEESPKQLVKKHVKSKNVGLSGSAAENERSSKKKRLTFKKEENTEVSNTFNKMGLHECLQKQEPKVLFDAFSRTINGENISDRQPALVSGGIMRSYQLDALDWLKTLYENGVNGILADEMGLGKTIECIALIAYLIEMGIGGPYIIMCPLSTLHNWVSEFRKFAPLIPVLLYHGTKEERKVLRRKLAYRVPLLGRLIHPILITSYSIALNDRIHLSGYHWMIIIDEAHRIKNFHCVLVRELKKYRSTNRLLLTGTPLQNNLAELWSLLNFLLPEVFDDLQVFESWFDIVALTQDDVEEEIIVQEKENQIISTIHQILSPFLLRRTKADVSLELPLKKEVIVYAPLTPKQKRLYAAVVDDTIYNFLSKKDKRDSWDSLNIKGKRKRLLVNYSESKSNVEDLILYGIPSVEEKNGQPDLGKLEFNSDEIVLQSPEECKREFQGEENFSIVNINMNNVLMMLRKICNHPYLVEFPLNPATDDYLINEDLIKSCGKLSVLDLMLRELKKRGHKVLIFSQLVILLNILRYYCEFRGYTYNYLDGNVKIDDRQQEIDDFNTNSSTFLFLISTRAGGLGINLTAADTVIIYDSDWNPQVDLQAQDRCHRIGQTKPVVVYRLVTAKTVDERIVDRACAKRKLEKMIIRKGRFASQDNMRIKDVISQKELLELLQSKDYCEAVDIEDLLSPERLNMLLDRSDMFVQTKEDGQKIHSQSSVPTEIKGLFKVVPQTDLYEQNFPINK